jgi:hypothetical protein
MAISHHSDPGDLGDIVAAPERLRLRSDKDCFWRQTQFSHP